MLAVIVKHTHSPVYSLPCESVPCMVTDNVVVLQLATERKELSTTGSSCIQPDTVTHTHTHTHTETPTQTLALV